MVPRESKKATACEQEQDSLRSPECDVTPFEQPVAVLIEHLQYFLVGGIQVQIPQDLVHFLVRQIIVSVAIRNVEDLLIRSSSQLFRGVEPE